MHIEPLSKITADLVITPADTDHSPQSTQAEFIYGLGSGGLTDFELLLGKAPPETMIELTLNRSEIGRMFKHLACLVPLPKDMPGQVTIHARVTAAQPADSREIVRAMAASQQCGEGCDCGCGH
jgi:hypothetical protein